MRSFILLLTLSPALLFGGCSADAPPPVHQTRYMMGTLVEFTIFGAPRNAAERAIAAAAREMGRVEARFTTAHDSPVRRFNRDEAPLPDEVGRLLAISIEIQRQSGGAFHPGLGGLNALWGFSSDRPRNRPLPTARQIAAQRPPRRCFDRQGDRWRRRDPRCRLDFGGIAKGYAIDRGIAVLKAHHIANAIINAGGDMRILGRHGARKWRIGIRHPRRPGAVVAALELEGDRSVVTSGDYERFVIVHGRRYHHILDPTSGRPARRAMSATVIADDATRADGWSTALFVLGPAGLPLIERLGMEGMVVDGHGQIHQTPGLRRYLARRWRENAE
ncbi:MAG: FAD:protein FMN transferase [Zetaproteobacteria bacterium]|nr:MAG: FAD:protein FMN transferase [Zetaproteobacteria bacterium]